MISSTRCILGQSEMARTIRENDWSQTAIGEVDGWSDDLLNAVNLILAAPLPMQLFWGPDFACIYNDAMAPALSDKHPESLGMSARQVWAEAWGTIGPQITAAFTKGEATRVDDLFLPLLRNGILEDQYWTYSYSPVFDGASAIVGVLDVAQDTTNTVLVKRDLAKTHEVLRRSEERFRQLIDRASVGINIGDSSGKLSYMNAALLKLIGYSAQDVAEGTVRWDELTPPHYADADNRALTQLQATGVATPYEKVYRAKDGHLVPVQIGATLIPALSPDANDDDIAVFFTDLTRQKKAEAALLQSEKISAVGKLASAISHEINNPLEAVTNVLYIVRNLAGLSVEAKDYLDIAERELARVSHAAAQTLRFHRLSNASSWIAPDRLLEDVVGLYESRLSNYGIKVERGYAAGITFQCFEGDIRQVMNNIFSNAVAEMGRGGIITLRTRRATRASDGQMGVLMTVSDSGPGIPAVAKERLFDAFFTTKGIHGTGLGLWIACRIIRKHRGYIRAHNRFVGQPGAVFQVWLPTELAPSASEPWHIIGPELGLV